MQIPSIGPVKFPNINGAFVGGAFATAVTIYLMAKGFKAIADNTSGIVRDVAEKAEEVVGG